ncbi:MAG: HD domain-containing phosphohydrolase [Thiobacillus sp.]|nr:HD domain-containing phosphohydrolase [Thiobacillus sp.]
MANHRISLSAIKIGQPLPWDVMDNAGKLLLRKGHIIEKLALAEALVERGMYIESGHAEMHGAASPAKAEAPSTIRTINLIVRRLDMVLRELKTLPDPRDKILEIVKMIHVAVDLNADIALASLLLNGSSGTYPVRHCVDSAILSTLVAQAMNKPADEIQDLTAAALTMNISMLFLQHRLQRKSTPLSDDEKDQIHRHPYLAIELLSEIGIEDPRWLTCILRHHEHEDGTGYPSGALKTEIPQISKILALADGYCARITPRDYRKAIFPNLALRDIFIENSSRADPALAAYFIQVLGLYQPGTFVRLKNHEIAVVSQRGSNPTACTAYSLVNASGERIATPIKRETNAEPFTIVEALHPSSALDNFDMKLVWGAQASM